jgi:ubiquinone biosynthesis protein COQ9
MFDLATPRGRILDAAFKLAAAKPWRDVSLNEIAQSSGVGLVDLSKEFYGKLSIAAAFTKLVDEELLRRARLVHGTDESPRDRVFDVIMTRFDILQPYRAALKSIVREGGVTPGLDTFGRMMRSQHWMLVAAGLPADGPAGRAREAALLSVYARTFQEWLDDEDPGRAKTMAVLDRRLRNGERWMQTFEDVRGRMEKFGDLFKRGPRRGREDKPADAAPPNAGPSPY